MTQGRAVPGATQLIESAVARATQLATLPEVALEVMRLVRDPKATGDDLVRVLSRDPALIARVLKIVNSAYYGTRREITSISAAVAVIGFAAVNSVAVAASLARMYRVAKPTVAFEPRELWTHAVAVGVAARLVATHVHVDPNEAFLAGLVHDLGMIVEMQVYGEKFAQLIDAAAHDSSLPFEQAETRFIGATHAQFGEALCRTWRFPTELQRVCEHHHNPMALAPDVRRLTAIVYVADHLAAQHSLGYSRTVQGSLSPEVLTWLSLGQHDLDAINEVLAEQVALATPLLGGD